METVQFAWIDDGGLHGILYTGLQGLSAFRRQIGSM